MKKQFYAYLHTHWDLEWYRDIFEFNIRFLDVFDIVLDELKKGNAPFFYLDGQVIALLNYLKYRPHKLDEIKTLIKDKKLAIGPYYVISDSYLVSINSLLKNLKLGLKISKEFNQKDYIGYLSDIFGISKSAFDVLELNNINKALIWRGVNPKLINNNCDFKYNSINTTWLVQGYFNDYFNQKNPDINLIKKSLDKINKYSSDCAILPIGADHLGMLKDADKKIKEINSKLDDYEIILTNPFEYFKKTKFINTNHPLEFLDNSDTYILSGVYSARIHQKIKNYNVQNKLSRIVEPLNYYLKDNFNNQIEDIYKTLILNHAHDGIYGCSIDNVHKLIDKRLFECDIFLDAILEKLKANFKNKYNITDKSTNKIGLFNLSNNSNIKTVEIKLPYILKNSQVISKEKAFPKDLLNDIYKIPVTEDITTIYTQLIEIDKNNKFEFNTPKILKPVKKVFVTNNSIWNNNIKLEIINNKIFIKNSSKSYLLKLTDVIDTGDSYNFSPKGKYKTLDIIKTKIIYDGLIEAKLRLYFKNIELDIILNNNSEFIKFNYRINNKKKNHKVGLSMVLDDLIYSTTASDPIGTIKRTHDPNYNIFDYMPCKRPWELKTNSYPMFDFVMAKGVTILTKGLNEYTIYKNELKITLLRCFDTISNPKNPTRAIPAGPNLKTPMGQCIFKTEGEFAILLKEDEKESYKALDEFLNNYVTIAGGFKKDLKLSFDNIKDNLFIYGLSNNKKISYNLVDKKIYLI